MLIQKAENSGRNVNTPYVVINAPAFGEIPAGSTWLFSPAENERGEATMQFLDLSEKQAMSSPDEYEAAVKRFSRICLSIDYSQGANFPGTSGAGLRRQVLHMLEIAADDVAI